MTEPTTKAMTQAALEIGADALQTIAIIRRHAAQGVADPSGAVAQCREILEHLDRHAREGIRILNAYGVK